MKEYTKSIRKELQVLNGLAHERYLDQALTELQQQFSRWHSKEINAFELNAVIHQFHNGRSRDLYNYFGGGRDMNAIRVAKALAEGMLTEAEISRETLEIMTNTLINYHSNE